MVAINDTIPSGTLQTKTYGSERDVYTNDLFYDKRVVLFGIAGAFNPMCEQQYQSFLDNYDALKDKGIEAIYCLSVNDPNTMENWWKSLGSSDKITMLSDGSGTYIKYLGLEQDLSSDHMGQRSRRFSMLIDKSVIVILHVEDAHDFSETSGSKLVEEIK